MKIPPPAPLQRALIATDMCSLYSIVLYNNTSGRMLHAGPEPVSVICVCDMNDSGEGENHTTFAIDDIVNAWKHLTTKSVAMLELEAKS